MSRPVYEAGKKAVRNLRNGNVVYTGACAIYARRELEKAIADPEFNSMDVILDWKQGVIEGLLES